MKKKLVLAMAAIFVLFATAVPAFASATSEKCAPVCMSEFVDADGDGICDNAGKGQGKGNFFVDADGDGVCDNAGQSAGRCYRRCQNR